MAEFEALREDIAAAEAALRASEARWRALFERMHEGFALCEIIRDGNGRAVDWRYLELNAAWERLTGIPVERALGRRVTEVSRNKGVLDPDLRTSG
ncbi:PAS domain-containing protein [Siccirubricoccus deserti]